jgi:predicted transcriptional regulator
MEKKRRGGWPVRTPEPGERVPMSFRVTSEFKARLDRAAKESGRSLAQEIELRLERSLDQERHLTEALELGFGRQVAGLMLGIGYLIKEVQLGRRPGDIGWLSDPTTFQEIVESINLLLEAIDPNPHPEAWTVLRRAINGDGQDAALHASVVAQTIADPDFGTGTEFMPLLSISHRWVGAAAVARLKDRLAMLEEDTASGPQEE